MLIKIKVLVDYRSKKLGGSYFIQGFSLRVMVIVSLIFFILDWVPMTIKWDLDVFMRSLFSLNQLETWIRQE